MLQGAVVDPFGQIWLIYSRIFPFGAVDRKSATTCPPPFRCPSWRRAECGSVELDRSFSVIDGEHGSDLASHRVHADIDTSRTGSFRNELDHAPNNGRASRIAGLSLAPNHNPASY